MFTNGATGNQTPHTGSNLTFNSSSGALTATSFSGDGSNLTGIDTDLVSDTSPQLGGTLDANGNDIEIDDGNFLKFGGTGLTIRTNANNAYITEGTSGKLEIAASNLQFSNAAASQTYAYFTDGGAAALYHAGTSKLETTSDGITITRNTSDTTMTNTSQLVLRNANDGANTFAGIRFEVSSNSNTDHYIVQKKHSGGSGTDLIVGHGSNERIRFIESGGITFNGDTSSANALDDYEEGEVTISTTASNGNALTVDSSHNKLTYTKIGNVVNIFGYVYFASNSNADGYVQINSLPFTVKNATGSSAHARFVNTAYLTRNYAYLPDGAGYYNVQGYANESNTWLRYYDLNGSGRRLSTLAKFLGSGTVINVNFAYLTA